MTERKRGPLSPDLFPRIAEFAAGYLHQDFALEHKTPEHALRAFLKDASAEERDALVAELHRFREAAQAASWTEVRAAFEALGGAWRPASRAALETVLQVATRRASHAKGKRS